MKIEDYRDQLKADLNESRNIATAAREKKYDPAPFVEMEFAEDIAGRCEKLLMIEGLAERIHTLEEKDLSREEIAIRIADAFADGEIGDYEKREEMVDSAIRTAVALLTEGVVAAPIDGIGKITIESNDSGGEFIRIPYYGPIRSAGGTGQALSILVADYIRQKLGIGKFDARDDEVERYVEELHVYDREINLQYLPPDDDIRHIIRNCSVMVDGIQTTNREVEGYRDLERIDGNRGRGGMCLVVGEGIAQKAPKLQKYTNQMEIEGWGWLEPLTSGSSNSEKEDEENDTSDDTLTAEEQRQTERENKLDKLKPKEKFITDLIGGRPVFSGASRKGGFRLRYGRARNVGLAACGYHPATMVILDEFLATGTQLKTERPGKAAGVAPVDGIEGPTVRLSNGEMKRIDCVEEAEKVVNAVEEIIDVGEVVIPFGEFLENNHPLAPSSYVHEWWIQEYKRAGGDMSNEDVTQQNISAETAFSLAESLSIPLHPKYTYFWDDLESVQDDTESSMQLYESLSREIETRVEENGTLDYVSDSHRKTLEWLLVPHIWNSEENKCYFEDRNVRTTLEKCCKENSTGKTVRERAQDAAGATIRERAPLRIGARMGRPEKSKRRQMNPPVHALFPIGEDGGNQRDIVKASNHSEETHGTLTGKTQEVAKKDQTGITNTPLSNRSCPVCKDETWKPRCPTCDELTEAHHQCPKCGSDGDESTECPRCEVDIVPYKNSNIDIKLALEEALETLNETPSSFNKLKGVKRLSSESRIPEPIEKGILRAKHDIDVFRDGTSRFDMMDLPLTAFKAEDIDVDIEELHNLGYTEGMDGSELEDEHQLVEILPQDLILSERCGDYLLRVAKFIDELLVGYYDLEPFYQAEHRDDLIGESILGLAPHTSAGVLGRIIGFTDAAANFASPFYHAGKRRNADGDEDCVMLLMDGLLNFSKKFLPDRRGARSIAKDTTVFVEQSGVIKTPEIQTVVDDAIDKFGFETRSDGFEVCRDFGGSLKAVSFDSDGAIELAEISALIRHSNDKDVYKIGTGGYPITVTGDHSVFTYKDGSVVEKDARKLSVGDVLITPAETPNPEVRPFGRHIAKEVMKTGHFNGTKSQVAMGSLALISKGLKPQVTESDNPGSFTISIDGELESLETHRGLSTETIESIEEVDYGDDYVYDFEVPGKQNFLCGPQPIFAHNTMDAPLVVSTVLDPLEVDDEAHNVDIAEHYPLEFYEKTYEIPSPKEIDIPTAKDITDTGVGFNHTIETSSISAGPTQSAYKHIEGMREKTFAQLELARKTHAVDESVIAEMVIEKHFMPDIIGNLTAFGRQKTRCHNCGEKYRRIPLSGNCHVCNTKVILTVHEGSVNKYIELVEEIAEVYGASEYTNQRIAALRTRIESLFQNDHNKQSGLQDFI